MIYLNQNESNTVRIPKYFQSHVDEYVLTLVNNLDGTVHTFTLNDDSEFANYYKFVVDIDDTFAAGEYNYTLEANADVLCIGIMTVGSYVSESTQYEHTNTYTQYNG